MNARRRLQRRASSTSTSQPQFVTIKKASVAADGCHVSQERDTFSAAPELKRLFIYSCGVLALFNRTRKVLPLTERCLLKLVYA